MCERDNYISWICLALLSRTTVATVGANTAKQLGNYEAYHWLMDLRMPDCLVEIPKRSLRCHESDVDSKLLMKQAILVVQIGEGRQRNGGPHIWLEISRIKSSV